MESIENWLYPIPDHPKRTRTKPMKVLALGMSRSGTESLRRALQILGYDHVYHGFDLIETTSMTWKAWTLLGRRKYGAAGKDGSSGLGREDFDALLGHCEAVTDQPCALFAPELIQAYPEAKVILNRRDVGSWYHSMCDSFLTVIHSAVRAYVFIWFDPDLYWNARYGADVFVSFFHRDIRRHAKWVYEDHSAKVRGYVPAERLLEWTIGDGWEPLCRFLDKPIPSQEFPSGNSGPALMERYNKSFEKPISNAKRNLGVFLLVMGALAAYAIQRSFSSGM